MIGQSNVVYVSNNLEYVIKDRKRYVFTKYFAEKRDGFPRSKEIFT